VDAASRAAADAMSASESAREAADQALKVQDELKALSAQTRKDARFARGIAFAEFLVGLLVLGVLTYQGFKIREQIEIARKNTEQTQQQIAHSSAVSEFSVVKQLQADTFDIQSLVYDEGSAFYRARQLGCEPFPRFSAEIERNMNKIVSHYEKYYFAYSKGLITSNQWRSACLGAKDIFAQNCLVSDLWEKKYRARVSEDFRSDFIQNCKVAKQEDEAP
jgi:hypothetical protein